MDPILRRRQITTTLTGWLLIGILLAVCERWIWNGLWSVTLVVWWGYLIISVLMLLRLLIHSWASRWSKASLGVVWIFVGAALLLLWVRPIFVRAGDQLILNFRPETQVEIPVITDGPPTAPDIASGTRGRS